MAKNPEQTPVSPEAMQLGYEPQRISIRALVLFIVLFAAGMVTLQAMLAWMMHHIEAREDRMDVPRSILTVDQQPPPPNLQPSIGHDSMDYQDLERYRQAEDQMFAKLGWEVDLATHRVSIPAEIVRKVAEEEQARAAASYVPPTTTGKDSNSTGPGSIPRYDTQPGISGGQRP
jgi:hypothetical protein